MEKIFFTLLLTFQGLNAISQVYCKKDIDSLAHVAFIDIPEYDRIPYTKIKINGIALGQLFTETINKFGPPDTTLIYTEVYGFDDPVNFDYKRLYYYADSVKDSTQYFEACGVTNLFGDSLMFFNNYGNPNFVFSVNEFEVPLGSNLQQIKKIFPNSFGGESIRKEWWYKLLIARLIEEYDEYLHKNGFNKEREEAFILALENEERKYKEDFELRIFATNLREDFYKGVYFKYKNNSLISISISLDTQYY